MKEKKLTSKEEAFIQNYISNGFNGTKAAISAGYSENSSRQIADQNLSKLHISERIDEYKKEQANKNDVTIKEIIENARYIVEKSKEKDDMTSLSKGNEQLGKTIGAFTEVVKTDHNIKLEYKIVDEIEKDV